MVRSRKVSGFPWDALDTTTRERESSLWSARRVFSRAARAADLAESLGRCLQTGVQIVFRSHSRQNPPSSFPRIGLALADGSASVVVGMEPALACTLLSTLLQRPVPMVVPGTDLDSVLSGALSALLIEAARGSSAAISLVPSDAQVPESSPVLHVTVILGQRPYAAALWPRSGSLSVPPEPPEALLRRLGEIEIALPLVAAASVTTPAALAELVPGAAFCAGGGFSIDASGYGSGVLVSGWGELGFRVELRPSGEIVLGQAESVPLASAERTVMESDQANQSATLAEAVLEAPLVVRVELGQVSLPAREWAALRPGDVIETGRRIAEPVVLRAGGRVLARGELVNVEGELGVRVIELLSGERA